MQPIYCETCKYQDRDEWDMPCRGCKVLKADEPPTGYYPMPIEELEEELTNEVNPSYVDHPAHYQSEGGMECIDEMVLVFGVEAVKDFCICNVWKYRFRQSSKNGDEDMEKSHWYMRKYKELCEEGLDVRGLENNL